jgi:hypothetical protein
LCTLFFATAKISKIDAPGMGVCRVLSSECLLMFRMQLHKHTELSM